MSREKFQLNDPTPNDRPNSRWMCGRDDETSPCSHGPFANGRCPLANACRPRRTWLGRRKQVSTLILALAVLATFLMLRPSVSPKVFKPGELSTPHAQILSGTQGADRCAACHSRAATMPSTWFQPDHLGHEAVTQTDRCLDCHHQTIKRDRATNAHNVLPATLAALRSNVRLASVNPGSAKKTKTTWHDLMPGPSIEQDNVQCSACHREHRGLKGDLLDVSDSQCQTCHSDRFGSFATSHPAWDQWPYGRTQTIAFDHQTHANKHYPASQKNDATIAFDCAGCHKVESNGELARSPSYEMACSGCHDRSLSIEAAQGVELIALPTVPEQTARKLVPWPESATGYYDGRLAPITELLLRIQKEPANALRQIPNANFGDIDGENPKMVESAALVADQHKRLIAEFSSEGQSAILRRAIKAGVRRDLLTDLIRSLPPQLLHDTYQRWFTEQEFPVLGHARSHQTIQPSVVRLVDFSELTAKPPTIILAARPSDDLLLDVEDEIEGDDSDLLADPLSLLPGKESDALMSDDDLLTDLGNDEDLLGLEPLGDDLSDDDLLSSNADTNSNKVSLRNEARFDPDTMLPLGGWYRDDLRMTISYRGSGHSDPVLRAVVAVVSQLAPSDPVRKRLLATRSIAACVACHPSAAQDSASWESLPLVGRRDSFTKFAHGPHLHIAELADCSGCHVVSKTGKSLVGSNITLTSDLSSRHDESQQTKPEFERISLQTCAACHTAKAAGDNCTKCHRYHVDF